MKGRTRFTAKLVLGLALAAAAPVASAQAGQYIPGYTDFPNALRVADQLQQQKYIAGYTDFPNWLRFAPPGTIKVATPTISAAAASPPGFDWGDAGVGAGVTAGAALLLVGTAAGLRRRTRLSVS
jgi:hypothetical protein